MTDPVAQPLKELPMPKYEYQKPDYGSASSSHQTIAQPPADGGVEGLLALLTREQCPWAYGDDTRGHLTAECVRCAQYKGTDCLTALRKEIERREDDRVELVKRANVAWGLADRYKEELNAARDALEVEDALVRFHIKDKEIYRATTGAALQSAEADRDRYKAALEEIAADFGDYPVNSRVSAEAAWYSMAVEQSNIARSALSPNPTEERT